MADINAQHEGAGMASQPNKTRQDMFAEIRNIAAELGCPLEVAAAIYSDERRQDNPLNRFAEVFLTALFESVGHFYNKLRVYLDDEKERRRKQYEEGKGRNNLDH